MKLTLNFDPFPALTTERLLLRQIVPADAPAFFNLRSNEHIMRYIARPKAATVSDVLPLIATLDEARLNRQGITWGISLINDPELMGTIGFWRLEERDLRAEIGYLLHGQLHGKGIMSEALQAVLAYGFHRMGLHAVEGHIDPANTASEKLLLRFGFIKEAYFRDRILFEGMFSDSAVYTLFNR